jgi:putative nucleotidyltransferase with HDIG domain
MSDTHKLVLSNLPKTVLHISETLQKAGFTAYIVGGAVRDLLLDIPCSDWDFTTNATPEQIQALFPDSFYDNTFGTVGIAGKHIGDEQNPEEVYEITTYRSESAYSDHRRPDMVTWGQTIEDDLKRRDFTVNAMALELVDPAQTPTEVSLIDLYSGQKDVQDKTIRAVGDPNERFQEDALRMMRAIRQGAQLGFAIEQKTLEAIAANSQFIVHISWERVRDELLKLLVSRYAEQGLALLASTGLMQHIIPELLAGQGLDQRGHHIYDVWTHTIKAVAACPSTDPVVRLAVLLHDIAKPVTVRTEESANGEVLHTFHSHEVVGARMARDIALRLRLPKKDVQRVFTLVRWHMFVYDKNVTDAYIRRFIRRVGLENIHDMIALREADRVGSGSNRTSWRLEEMKERIEEQLHQPFSLKDMAMNGNDLMKDLGMQPGPKIGEVLKVMFEEVLQDPEKNTKEWLMEKAKGIVEK